ncbi:MAG: DUF2281 domain-containing protein [Planctomycetes bacterium]|nr:DUF2281 domain-containing protein [Planctomycetota bacterium]
MSSREMLDQLLENMPEDRVREVVDFAAFLKSKEEREEWRQFGQAQLARAYGPNEPEYTRADLRPEVKS